MSRQKGFAVPQALMVLTILMLLGITFLGVVRQQMKTTRFEQDTITAGYIAEIGFQQIRSELARAQGEWTEINGIVSDCSTTTNPCAQRCQHQPADSNYAAFRRVYDNPSGMVSSTLESIIANNKFNVKSGDGLLFSINDQIRITGCGGLNEVVTITDVTGDTLTVTPALPSSPSGGEFISMHRSDRKIQGIYEVLLETGQKRSVFNNKTVTGSTTGFVPGTSQSNEKIGYDRFGNKLCSMDENGCPGDFIGIRINAWLTDSQGQVLPKSRSQSVYGVISLNSVAGADGPAAYLIDTNEVLDVRQNAKFYGPLHTNQNFRLAWESLPTPDAEALSRGNPANTADISLQNPSLGILQIEDCSWSCLSLDVYQPSTDFTVFPFNTFGDNKGYIDWCVQRDASNNCINPGASEPSTGSSYEVRHITHQGINIYGSMTYSGNAPQFRYRHLHRVGGQLLYKGPHSHNNVMGVNLAVNSLTDYISGYDHEHNISSDLLNSPPSPNTFLGFADNAYKPVAKQAHNPPMLKPIPFAQDPGQVNYYNQLEQLNKYLQLTLGLSMPRNSNDQLNPASLPTQSDYAKGYLSPQSHTANPSNPDPSESFCFSTATSPLPNKPFCDFRAVYFGKDLEIGGQKVATGTAIWVNENDQSANYMQVSNTQVDSNYRYYTYLNIPDSKIVLVRDAYVLFGNYQPLSNSCAFGNFFCKDNALYAIGRSTIIDGELTLTSFTTTPPDSGAFNKGDIILVGNVIYRNQIVAIPPELRQADPASTANFPPASLSASNILWVTNVDGTLARDSNGALVGRRCGLGLFASNDIKIPVAHYWGATNEDSGAHVDKIEIHGQLVAGNQVAVYNPAPSPTSNFDQLITVGTIYSLKSPVFSNYFKKNRAYYFDKALFKTPLLGAPYFPNPAGDYRNQSIFSNFPQLVSGTWQMVGN